MQEKSSRHYRLSQPIFLKHLNKTHQSIMCETEIKITYIKKHVYKERKETIHEEVYEKNIHRHHIYKVKIICKCWINIKPLASSDYYKR